MRELKLVSKCTQHCHGWAIFVFFSLDWPLGLLFHPSEKQYATLGVKEAGWWVSLHVWVIGHLLWLDIITDLLLKILKSHWCYFMHLEFSKQWSWQWAGFAVFCWDFGRCLRTIKITALFIWKIRKHEEWWNNSRIENNFLHKENCRVQPT